MKIVKSKKLAPATPELAALLARIAAASDDDLPGVLDGISEWCWPRGDLHYWIGTLNRFDGILEKICKDYEVAKVQANEFTPLCKKLLLSVLRFSRLLIENCTNRKLYASYEHLNDLLLTRDIDVLEATLRFILRPAQQRSSSSHSSRNELNISHSRLAALAVTWPTVKGASDMVALCSTDAAVPPEASAVHFTFYRASSANKAEEDEQVQQGEAGSSSATAHTPARPQRARSSQSQNAPVTPANAAQPGSSGSTQRTVSIAIPSAANGGESNLEGLVTVDIPASDIANKPAMDIFSTAVERHSIPSTEHFELFQKIRVASCLSDPKLRQQMISCRLLSIACYAHLVSEHTANSQLFLYERELVSKTASIIEPGNHVSQEVKAAAVYALDAMGRYRNKLGPVLNSVQASVSHGLLLRVLRELVDELSQPNPTSVDIYVDSVFGFTAFLSSIPAPTGNGMAMSSAVLPLLVKLVATPDPEMYMVQRTITRAVGLIDSVNSTHPNAYTTYTNARGVETLVSRIQAEVERDIRDYQDTEPKPVVAGIGDDSPYGSLPFGRASLLRHQLKSIMHDLHGAGTPDSLRTLLDSTILQSVKLIMQKRKTFGPQIFSLAINIMATFVHNEPTALSTIQEQKLPQLFLDCVEEDIEAHLEVIMAIPNAIGALSLNQAGLDMFVSRPLIPKLLALFTSERHIKVLQDEESAANFGAAIDELIRHQPSMKDAVFAGINAMFDRITEASNNFTPSETQRPYYQLMAPKGASTSNGAADVEMTPGDSSSGAANEAEVGSNSSGNATPPTVDDEATILANGPSRTSEEHTVLSYIKAMARFLEMLFQTPHHCKDFLKSDGLTKLLSLYSLPTMPADFYNHLAGDAIVQLIRLIADASPHTVFHALFKDIKTTIDAVPLDFHRESPGKSQLAPTTKAVDEDAIAASNALYRKTVALCTRLHLLGDCLHTYNVPGHKLPSGFISSLFSSLDPRTISLVDLGYQFRFWTWEYLQLTAAKAEKLSKDSAKDGSDKAGPTSSDAEKASGEQAAATTSAAASSSAGAQATSVNTTAGVASSDDDIPDEAIDSPSSSKEPLAPSELSTDPEFGNLHVWQEMSGAISTTIRDFFQELTRLLSPRRSSEATSLRRTAPNAMEQMAQCIMLYYRWIGDLRSEDDFPEIGYATIVLRHTQALLYDERSSSSSRTQTQLIFKFFQADGLQAMFRLYEGFNRELTKHFEETTPDQSGHVKHAPKFHHICGALRILLSLFQNLVTSKLVHESAQTAQLLLKEEPKSSANYFEPADFLVRVRSEVLSIVNASLTSNWLCHLPVSVNRLVIQILLEILRAEGETPLITKKDEAQAVQDRFANSLLSSLTSATAIRRATAAATVNETQVQQLADMGFPRAAARHALLRTNNDVTAATEYLIVHPDVVQSMQDEPTGSSTPSGAAAAEGSSSNAESSAAGAIAPPPPADGDVAMGDSSSSSAANASASNPIAAASSSNEKAPETKTVEKDQPFTDAGMAAKEKLDKERDETRGNIFQHTLDLANHHEDLVFEVRDAFSLVAADKSRASESLQAVLGIVLSAGSTAFAEEEKSVAVRMHAMAVIMNDDKLLKALDEETVESTMSVCMMLIEDFGASRKPDALPSWFASNLLTVAPLLSLEYEVQKVDTSDASDEGRVPLPLDKILPNFDKFASERTQLMEFCLTALRQPAQLKRDGLLAIFRVLVHLTRRRSAAVEFLKSGGLQLLFQPFKNIPAAEQTQCQAQTLIILRHIVEDADTLRVTMEQELQSWMSLGRTKTVDITNITRQLAHVVMRDPEMFLNVAKERLQMTEWSMVKDNASVRFVQPEAPATSTQGKTPVLSQAEQHDPDTSFGAPPASPTKGAHDFDMDASMHELGGERGDSKPAAISESAESVVHFLLAELHRSTKDALICRNIVSQPNKSSGSTNGTAPKGVATPASSVAATGTNGSAVAGTTKSADAAATGKDAETATSSEKAVQDSTYLFSCFLMQTLMELLSSYMSCKLAFVNLCRRRTTTTTDVTSQPRLKLSMLQYFLNELTPAGFIRTDDHEQLRKRMAQTNLAMSVIVALTADVAIHPNLKETPQDLVAVRRYVLDGIVKAIREAVTSSEATDVRYGRIYAQSDLCYRLLTARPNVSAGKPAFDASLFMAKTMLEKHFVTVLTTTLGEIDLKTPTVKPLLDTILRPLEYLTKAAIKMGKAERKAKEESVDLDDVMSSDESEAESEDLSALEEEAMLERDQRQETPDFYRNSSLGMHTGEMEQQPIYDDEEMEDEDEMDEDDVDMGEYDTDEDGSDLSSLDGEEVDIDDMSGDEMSDDESDEEDDDDEDEDDEMDDDEDGEDGEDDDSWATEEEEEDVDDEEGEATLDFVLGEGEEGDELGEGAIVGGFVGGAAGAPLPGLGGDGLGEIEDDDADTQEDALSAEEPYDLEEFAHLEFADEGAGLGRGQADDRFGANWGWAAIPPAQLARDSAGGAGRINPFASRSRRRHAMLDQALHGAHRPATSGEGAAYHPLLEQRPVVNTSSRASHSHRHNRRFFSGFEGRHDGNGGFMHSFEEMMGTGTMQFLENLVGMAPADASIRINVAGGPGGMGQFQVDGESAVLEQLFGRSAGRTGGSSAREPPKQEDPVALAQQFNPLPTAQRWSEAARIIYNTETLERSQRMKGHVINTLYPAYKVYQAEEEKKREAELEMRRKNLEAKAKAKDIEDKMSQSLSLTGGQDGTPGQHTPAETSAAASTSQTSSADDTFSTALQASSGDASRSVSAETAADGAAEEASADVEMAEDDGENGQGAATPRASTPRPTEPSSSATVATSETAAQTSTADSSAPAASSSAAQPAERQYTYVHGQRIDITDTGIDPTFLEALPDDMREEVLNQHFRERRAAATTAAAANSSIAPEFLDALPPEIRAEVIQQEAMENARRRNQDAAEEEGNEEEEQGEPEDEAANEAIDPAALLAQLNPSLRNSMLLENPDDLLAGLQSTLLGGASGSRRRHHGIRVAGAGGDGAGAKKPPPRDAIQLLDKGGVATLIRLYFFPDMNGRKNGLNNILSNLSENSRTRSDLLSLLLGILSDGTTDTAAVDRSFSSMSIRASRTSAVTSAATPGRPTPKRSGSGILNLTPGPSSNSPLTSSTTAPISVIGDEAPFLVATRVLESLLHLATVNEQAATFFLKDDPRLIKKTGKGKDKEKAESATAKAAGTAPVNTLLMLLKRPDILGNAQLVDALLAVLNTVTKPLVSLQAKKEASKTTTTAEGDTSAARPATAADAQASSSSSGSAAPAASGTTAADAASSSAANLAATQGDGTGQASDLLETAPQIASDRLAAVVRPLATPISSKGFQHTLSVASHLAAIDGARDTIGSALKSEAEAASRSLIVELDRLLESLPPAKPTAPVPAEHEMDTGGDGAAAAAAAPHLGAIGGGGGGGDASVAETEAKFDSPALTALASPASAQAVFLRSLRALDYLMTGR